MPCRGWGPAQGLKKQAGNPSLLDRAADVLQDMAVTIAEAVATAYLAEASFGLSGMWPLQLGSHSSAEAYLSERLYFAVNMMGRLCIPVCKISSRWPHSKLNSTSAQVDIVLFI